MEDAWAQRYGALAALVVLFVYNAIATPFFLSRQSLLFILLRQAAPIAIVAVGMAIVIGTGGHRPVGRLGDGHRGPGRRARWCWTATRSCWPSSPPCSVSALCGLFNGTLVARFGVQPIIATLILFIAGPRHRPAHHRR